MNQEREGHRGEVTELREASEKNFTEIRAAIDRRNAAGDNTSAQYREKRI
jgi:predicted lipase